MILTATVFILTLFICCVPLLIWEIKKLKKQVILLSKFAIDANDNFIVISKICEIQDEISELVIYKKEEPKQSTNTSNSNIINLNDFRK